MKILYLHLKNFASIYTSMRKKELKIDMSKSKNRVILLVGKNGSGKTSILSNLHPFAYPGNMDIRNGNDLILDEVDGYKEIHIKDNDDIYVIKHSYGYTKNGRIVKSYLSKNGEELNPNGNVTSFKELIYYELSLELEYLKLLRLGSNVINFIDMKAAERKSFTSNLLSDVDIYGSFYKKFNNDFRLLNGVLASVASKIAKLNIEHEKDVIEIISKLENELTEYKDRKDKLNSEIWKLDGSLNAIIPEGVEAFFISYEQDMSDYKDLLKEIQSKKTKLDKYDIIIVGDIEDNINECSSEIMSLENQINVNTGMIDFYFSQLNIYFQQKDDKENNLKYITSDLEYSKLNSLYLELVHEKEDLDKLYKNYVPKCTKDDMLTALRLMQELDKFISIIHSFNHDAVTEAINLINKKYSIESYVKENVAVIDDKINKHNLEVMPQVTGNKNDGVYVLFRPTDCKVNGCSYIKFYNDHTNAKDEATVNNVKSELKKLENRREFLVSLLDINKNIDYLLLLIKSNKELIGKLPEDFFNIKNILTAIKNCVPFFDEDVVTNYINALEGFEHYTELKTRIKDIKTELMFIEKNMTSITSMQKELQVIDNEINKLQKQIDDLKDTNQKLTKRINKLNTLKESLYDFKELSDEISGLNATSIKLSEEIHNKESIDSKIQEFLTVKKQYEGVINSIDKNISKVEDDINDNKFKLKEFKALKKEKSLLQEKFDDLSALKDSTSSNKGMPLLFIQIYLQNTKIEVNKLLSDLFDGTLEIDDFVIDDKEFTIPYFKNGIRISDITFTSQGERSFVVMALSFGLIKQSIQKYNIMLLDEIDATLDTSNRAMFINILENQLESIDAEQVFMITHNNMFDNYPVDLILTSPVETDNYKNMNIVYSV